MHRTGEWTRWLISTRPWNHRLNEVRPSLPSRTKIDVDILPCSGPMADTKFQPCRVGVAHVKRLALQLRTKLIEPERESTSKRSQPVSSS
jgi:hypothetical protein